MYEHNALGYWSALALCLTKIRSSRARCPATALIILKMTSKINFSICIPTHFKLNPKEIFRNWRCSRYCMKLRVGSSALELDFINSHIYFHTLVDIKNWSSTICIPTPFMFSPKEIFKKLKMVQTMKLRAGSKDNMNMCILIGYPIT